MWPYQWEYLYGTLGSLEVGVAMEAMPMVYVPGRNGGNAYTWKTCAIHE